MKTTVIHHSADFDGLFCREIARKFLPDAELIGWDFGDKPLPVPNDPDSITYVLDLPVDRVFGLHFGNNAQLETSLLPWKNLVWIDHHKSSIETHPKDIPGYRIDGVAACRLAWQWFSENATDSIGMNHRLPTDVQFKNREVNEPLAVRLAGEYDIWDKRDPRAELFQHGLRSRDLEPVWDALLANNSAGEAIVLNLLRQGEAIKYAKTQENADIITHYGFTLKWEGLTFLACNHARYNSFLFTAGLTPEHDACYGFKWTGKNWSISLYHAPGKEHHDLSQIAVKYGGGGHRGACGFSTDKLPFLP